MTPVYKTRQTAGFPMSQNSLEIGESLRRIAMLSCGPVGEVGQGALAGFWPSRKASRRRTAGGELRLGTTSLYMGAVNQYTLRVVNTNINHYMGAYGEAATRYLTELVHRRPRGWWVDVDRLHEILQSHGAQILREALEEGLQAERFDVRFVEEKLQGKLNFSE